MINFFWQKEHGVHGTFLLWERWQLHPSREEPIWTWIRRSQDWEYCPAEVAPLPPCFEEIKNCNEFWQDSLWNQTKVAIPTVISLPFTYDCLTAH